MSTKKNSAENITAVASAGSNNIDMCQILYHSFNEHVYSSK